MASLTATRSPADSVDMLHKTASYATLEIREAERSYKAASVLRRIARIWCLICTVAAIIAASSLKTFPSVIELILIVVLPVLSILAGIAIETVYCQMEFEYRMVVGNQSQEKEVRGSRVGNYGYRVKMKLTTPFKILRSTVFIPSKFDLAVAQ
jgi:hypothetical protein